MIKKILIVTGSLAFAFLLWYLFIIPYDYQVSFTAKTSPGTVFHYIGARTGHPIPENQPFERIRQQVKAGDSLLTMDWNLKSLNDSTTRVRVRITDTEHSMKNKIAILFTRSAVERISRNKITEFKKGLEEQLDAFEVKIDGISELPETYCACTSVTAKQDNKAQGMMQNNFAVPDFLSAHGIRRTGNPLVEITDWDINTGNLRFNFCFPIGKNDTLPDGNGTVFYRAIPPKKVIKATFRGNYAISDRAWYALIDYAKRHRLSITKKPIEVFHHNPNLGGNPLEWKADIYMPVKINEAMWK